MIYHLPSNNLYGDEPIPLSIPDHWDVHISRIQGYGRKPLNQHEIAEKIHSAIGAQPVSQGAKGKKSAVIIIDDNSRPTPCEILARAVIKELIEAGIPKDKIWFVAALGAHGAMNREDFIRKLGKELVEEFEIYNHNAFCNHVCLGETTTGIPIEINTDVMRAEYKIAIGTMMPHSYYGFSGGAKAVLPGISSINTITANHSCTSAFVFNMGNPDVRIRKDAEEAARMAALDFKIDVILNGSGQICELFAGDVIEEASQARKFAQCHYTAEFVADCDIVISNSYYKPLEATCAYTPEVIASLKEGGDFILAANSPYGCCVHYLYDKWGKTSPGGFLFEETFAPEKKMNHMIVFSKYTVKGMRDSWFIEESKGAEYIKDWNKVVEILDDGLKKKVVIYPTAECQILDNSSGYYDRTEVAL